jgi:hypothetical protein
MASLLVVFFSQNPMVYVFASARVQMRKEEIKVPRLRKRIVDQSNS